MKIAQEDIDEALGQEDMKACCEAVKRSNKNYNPNEMAAFRFGVTSATGGIDELVDQLGVLYGNYEFDDDDVKLLARNIGRKLLEVV